jgi:D-alanyl-D-alanine carboxypeptidase/Peptidase family M23
MRRSPYFWVAAEFVAVAFFMQAQPAQAFINVKSPARVGLRDRIAGSPESDCPYPKDDWLSGSVLRVKGKNVNSPVAPKKLCTHFELTDPLPGEIPSTAVKGLSVEGKRWQLGSENSVEGGFGPLKVIGGGLEPTGRMVFNPGFDYEGEFKVVAVAMDEASDTVVLEAFFRACQRDPLNKKVWVTCSPFVFPSGITWSLAEGQLFPVDISVWSNPLKLPANVKAEIDKTLKDATKSGIIQEVKKEAISAGMGIGTGLLSEGSSGGGGGSSSSGSGACTLYGHKKYSEASSLASAGNGEKLAPDAGAAFKEMKSAAAANGIDLTVISGFRSVESQKPLWNKQVAKQGSESAAAKISAPPGYSEHHTGYALDLGSGSNTSLNSSFAITPAYSWLSKNAKDYGFVQSFNGSDSVQNEPWHWKYTGSSAARRSLSGARCGSASFGSKSSPNSSSRSTGSRSSSGGYSLPFNGRTMSPVEFGTSSEFGPRARPCPTCSSYHRGLDYLAPYGSTVLAAADGVIVEQRWHDGLGYTVWIDHGSGYMTHYSHLQKGGFLGRVGSVVKMGSPIAISGNSGGASTGAHLHFGVKRNTQNGIWSTGEYINPRLFLK